MYPFFEPAKIQSMERMKAVREKTTGTSAVGRIRKAIAAQQIWRRELLE